MKNNLLFFIILLLLPPIVSAQATDDLRVKYNNPELIVDLGTGLWGTPVPVDFDGDGRNDILMTCHDVPFRGVYFFRNIATNREPLFDPPRKLSNVALENTKASYFGGELRVATPSKTYPDFANTFYQNPQSIPIDVDPKTQIPGRVRSNMWSYADFDGDGDADLLVGIDTWADYGWDNAYDSLGNWMNGPLRGYVYLLENQNGNYLNKGRLPAGGRDLETFGAPGVNMADFDRDGKPDLICGEFLDKLTWYRNTGTRTDPVFAAGKHLLDPRGEVIRLHVEMITPVAFDFDLDGHMDLIVGDEDGRVAWIRNTGKNRKGMPVFESPIYLRQKADNLKFGALSTPFGVDWDGDGRQDLICGNSAGNIAFIKNLGGGTNPVWDVPVSLRAKGSEIRIMAGRNGSIQGPAEEKWGYTTLTVADWDHDGKPDVIVNSIFGEIVWFRNTGDLINLDGPHKVKVDWGGNTSPKPVWNWWNPGPTDLVTQWRTTPVAVDWNKDGLTDLVVMDHEGYLAFYERFERDGALWLKPGRRVFFAADASVFDNHNRLKGDSHKPLRLNNGEAGKSGRRKLCLVDWNNDGRLDIIANSDNAAWFENVEQKGDQAYFVYRGDLSRVKIAGHDTSPTPVDWHGDGVSDLLLGAEDGHFYLLPNPIRQSDHNIKN